VSRVFDDTLNISLGRDGALNAPFGQAHIRSRRSAGPSAPERQQPLADQPVLGVEEGDQGPRPAQDFGRLTPPRDLLGGEPAVS
jgi:hypothetical protein